MKQFLLDAHRIYQNDGIYELVSRGIPYLACKFNESVESINRFYHQKITEGEYNSVGFSVMDEDWDNLIILDACRADYFEQEYFFNGTLETRVSRASKTPEFIRANFKNKQFLDTVYVSANPWFKRLQDELDSEVYFHYLVKGDSFNGATTRPSTLTDKAIELSEKYPNKRLIIHYLQPHDPYFDEKGNELFKLPSTCPLYNKHMGYSQADICKAYRSTLKLVLGEVDRLLQQLDGKTVITADHGELLGERMQPIPLRKYEHPEGIYVDELTNVPWFVVEFAGRKTINKGDESVDTEVEDNKSIEAQLKSLGYL